MMKRACRAQLRAQSTLEYILILAAVLVAVIVAARTMIQPAVNTSMTESKNVIEQSTKKMGTGLGLP